MPTITKRVFSGSVDGLPLVVSATGTTATLIHAVITASTQMDEVWMYAMNSSTNTVSIVICPYGNTASMALHFEVPPRGSPPELLLPGLCFQGGTASNTITIGASTSNCITIMGYVNRINQT